MGADRMKINWLLVLVAMWLALPVGAGDIEIDVPSGETISIFESAKSKENLFIYIPTHRGVSEGFKKIMPGMNEDGIDFWALDLITSYMLEPNKSLFSKIPVSDISYLIDKAGDMGYKKVFLYSISKSTPFALEVAYDYQLRKNNNLLKGHVMHAPQLWVTDQSTGETDNAGIASASNMPVFLIASEYGTKYHLTEKIAGLLGKGGSPVYTKKIKGVRGGFHMRPDSHLTKVGIEKRKELGELYRMAAGILSITEKGVFKETGISPMLIGKPNNNLVKVNLPYARPNIDLEEYSGGRLKMKEYDGKKVLVNFWASWCEPCVVEIPSMMRLRKKMGGNLEIITVNIGETKDQIKEFKERANFDFPIGIDKDGGVMKDWGVFVFPTNFIVGKDGKIIYKYTGSLEWDDERIVETLKAIK